MSTAAADRVSQVPLSAQFASFNRVFWIANTIEMLERLAYYGLRTVLPIYLVLAVESGGPQFDHIQKGALFGWWALVQTMIPVVTGGYADRYGYKRTVGVSIAIKVAGYLIMAFAVDIAARMTGGASLGVPGHPTTYAVFLVGAMLLALGTAVFKPGIQGILAYQLNPGNESTGWAVFYQLVNLGGWLGPFLAGYLRILDWKYVFVACAIIVSLNYLLLLTFAEPTPEAGLPARKGGLRVTWESLVGICEPRLLSFLVVFSGFWLMFHQLFDLLPNFIDQWVDARGPLAAIAPILPGIPEEWHGELPQEYLINVNAGLIMLLAFAGGYLTGKVRSMTAMLVGILISSVAIAILGTSRDGWTVVMAIALFSIGEMSASPTKMRYFASIAPPGKKGLYLGYINATNGIGWFIGSRIAGERYQSSGDIFVLARRYLVEQTGMPLDAATALPQTEVLPTLAARLGTTLLETERVLWDTFQPQQIWTYFAGIGLLSMVGLVAFDAITRRGFRAEPWLLMGLTAIFSGISYGPTWALGFVGAMAVYLALERWAPRVLPHGAI